MDQEFLDGLLRLAEEEPHPEGKSSEGEKARAMVEVSQTSIRLIPIRLPTSTRPYRNNNPATLTVRLLARL